MEDSWKILKMFLCWYMTFKRATKLSNALRMVDPYNTFEKLDATFIVFDQSYSCTVNCEAHETEPLLSIISNKHN